jgi:hypothetical protein
VTPQKTKRTVGDHGLENVRALFDPGEIDEALAYLRELGRDAPPGHRSIFADTIDRLIVDPSNRYVSELNESRPGINYCVSGARRLIKAGESASRMMRLSDESPSRPIDFASIAIELELAWSRFVCDILAGKKIRDDRTLTAKNRSRQIEADAKIIDQFSFWQISRRESLTRDGKPLDIAERVRRFKRAHPRLSDRKYRRLRELMKSDRLPTI